MRGQMIGLAAGLGAVVLPSLLPLPAQAERRAPGGSILGYVTAESRFGHGKPVSGPVRRGPQGRLEVRLPGGTWYECGRSCSDTLRRQTVDFWRNHGGPQGDDGRGYIQFKF